MIFDGISVVIKSEVCTLRFPGIMKIFTSIGSGPLDIVANLFTIGIPILFAMLAPNILSYVLPTYNSVESANDHLIFNTDTPMPTLTQTMTLDYSKGNVRGVIINSANILVQLIPQINGSFTLQMNDNYPKVYTDQKGEFIFVNIEPGYYIVVSPIIGKNYPGWKLFSEPSNSILIAGHITDLLANPFDYWYIKVKSGESIDLGILHQ
jgi:hypothetical protein